MYSVALRHELVAYHHLPIEGPEASRHSHSYLVEVTFRGPELDRNGFLLDICQLERRLEAVLSTMQGRTLNELDPFEDQVPTLENLCRVLWGLLASALDARGLEDMTVTVWESERACASYTSRFSR